MKYPWQKYQRWFLRAIIFTTIVTLVNSVLVIKYRLYGGEDNGFAIAFPIAAYGILSFAIVIYHWSRFRWLGTDSKYVKDNYQDIWKRFAPYWAGGELRVFEPEMFNPFINGQHDDGTDEKLNCIKYEVKITRNLGISIPIQMFSVEVLSLILHFHYN